jgi:hypothetical protein
LLKWVSFSLVSSYCPHKNLLGYIACYLGLSVLFLCSVWLVLF